MKYLAINAQIGVICGPVSQMGHSHLP